MTRARGLALACVFSTMFAAASPALSAARPGRPLPVGVARAPRAARRPSAPSAPSAPGADSPPAARSSPPEVAKAPGGPPLTQGGSLGGGEAETGAPVAEVDPLVDNGLTSPLCSSSQARGELSPASARNCETSGFVAAPAPTGNYGLDVHIDTGVLGLSEGGLLSVVQDIAIQPVWMALVWAVHALIVVLQWAFTIDLLDSAGGGSVGAALRHVQSVFTLPWLGLTLALAAVATVYTGLVRRRVGEALGTSLLMLAMIGTSLAIADDPGGTVGLVGAWANNASLGTLAVVTGRGGESRAGALAASADGIFAGAVEAPWCYLEFGDVGWCEEPARLEPRLRAAGLAIATSELSQARCREPTPGASCSGGGGWAHALVSSAQLLRQARTNGQLFLALPTNGPQRNSINRGGSLLRVLCGSADATECTSATASEAEFRTNRGTWPRLGGLLLIIAGALGLLLLLGFIIARLLAAALLGLLLLLLAPAAALAPALGEGGRELFRRWAGGLFAAVALKLVFAFLLGAVLVVAAVLASLRGLGWWTQWLLTSAFWWGAFMHRHVAWRFARTARLESRIDARPRPLGRRVREMFDTPRTALSARRAVRRPGRPAAELPGAAAARVPHEHAEGELEAQLARFEEIAGADRAQSRRAAPHLQRTLASRRDQLARVERARSDAERRGDTRRAVLLEVRGRRLRSEIATATHGLARADYAPATPSPTHPSRLSPARAPAGARAARSETSRFLDEQAALPDASSRAAGSARRDYRELAPLAGYRVGEYAELSPKAQREARIQIDRELAKRRALTAMTGDLLVPVQQRQVTARERASAVRTFESELSRGTSSQGAELPDSRGERPGFDRRRTHGGRAAGGEESRVMEDLRAVRDRRKRQLGFDNE